MFNKKQKFVMITLTLVILALGIGIYMNKSLFFDKSTVPANSSSYERIRNATPSLSASLKWEQTFGGSKQEKLIDAFYINGKLYVFGNTVSSDFDMNGIDCGFMAILTSNGSTVNFLPISKTEIEAVCIAEGGFLLTTAYPSSQAMIVDFDGNVIKSLSLFSTQEITKMLTFNDNGYSILSTSTSAGGKQIITITLIDYNLNLIYQIVCNENYSLYPLDMYCLGEQTIVFSHAQGADNRLCVTVFIKGKSPFNKYITLNESYTPYRVLPYNDGWVVCAIDHLSQAFLLKLSYSYALTQKFLFNISDCVSCDMRYSNNAYYVFANRNTGGFLAVVNEDISDSVIKTQSEKFSYYNDYKFLRAISIENGVVMGIIKQNDITRVPLTSTLATKAMLVGEYLVYQGDGYFGESDITVCLVDA